MRLVKIGIASVKTTVGAVRSNVDRALARAREMAAADVTVAGFQEQLVGGYPPEDLVQWRAFVDAQREALLRFAEGTRDAGTAFVIGLTVEKDAHRYNVAAVVHRGRVLGIVPKEKLPTYNVFYEARTFSRGRPGMDETIGAGPESGGGVPFGDLIFRFDWGVLGVEVCEDGWSPDGPMRRRAYRGAEVIVNVSSSPYRVGVQATRREMLATRSADNAVTLAYANAVGGQDGLIFDGGGLVYQNGRLGLERPRFQEGWAAAVVDLDRTSRLRAEGTTWRDDAVAFVSGGTPVPRELSAEEPGADRGRLRFPAPAGGSFFLPAPVEPASPRAAFSEELLDALALGVGDYFEKNRFKHIGVALSGGRDSMLALLIAWRWCRSAGRAPGEVLRAFYMPTRFSSGGTRHAAETICRELGVPCAVVSVDEAFEREIAAARLMLQPGEDLTPIALQNIQARLRAARMWNWANSTGGLFLQTGNMSEKAVGYTTIGGDLEGGLSVISNVPKTVVIALIEHLQARHRFQGIELALSIPAGPELAANQEGEQELMPFPILDACFALYAGEKMSPADLKAALPSVFPEVPAAVLEGHVDRFFRMFTGSIYKWVQAPLGLHVGNLDLDRERALQMPVVESDEWSR